MQQTKASIRALENQVDRLAQQAHNRPQGSLRSNTEAPPRQEENEHCKMIERRSGTQTEENP